MKVLTIINCVIIRLCSSQLYFKEGDIDLPPTITVVDSDHHDHRSINKKFIGIAQTLGFRVNLITLPENNVKGTINASRTLLNVVNLRIPPVGESDLSARNEIYVDLWQSNVMCPMTNCNFCNNTRLISESILKYNRLHEIIQLDEINFEDEVLICIPKNTPEVDFENIDSHVDISLKFSDDCDENMTTNTNTLAVITHKPLSDSTVPTIFYDIPYFPLEYKDRVPNSINLSAEWEQLKYAFMEFLKHMQWYRVAVLSDDSEYSAKISDDLLGMFVQEGITFMTEECESNKCDFTKELGRLKKANSKIIILNVDHKYAEKLATAIDNADMKQVKWIVRDWRVGDPHLAMRDVFSISIFPVYKGHDRKPPEGYASSIKEGLKIIQNTYRSVLGDRESLKREFVKEAKRVKPYHTYAVVRRHNNIISSMIINGNKVKLLDFKRVYKEIPSDLPTTCIVRSSDFVKACAHEELLLLVAVLVMFALFLLIIVVYFSRYRSRRHYNRFYTE